jgi:hypothetical protein
MFLQITLRSHDGLYGLSYMHDRLKRITQPLCGRASVQLYKESLVDGKYGQGVPPQQDVLEQKDPPNHPTSVASALSTEELL